MGQTKVVSEWPPAGLGNRLTPRAQSYRREDVARPIQASGVLVAVDALADRLAGPANNGVCDVYIQYEAPAE